MGVLCNFKDSSIRTFIELRSFDDMQMKSSLFFLVHSVGEGSVQVSIEAS